MLRLGEGEVLGGAFRGHRGWGRALARSLAPAHPDTPRLGSRPTRCSAHCCPRFRPNRGRAPATCIGLRASRCLRPGTRLRPCSGGASPVPSGPVPRLPTYASGASQSPRPGIPKISPKTAFFSLKNGKKCAGHPHSSKKNFPPSSKNPLFLPSFVCESRLASLVRTL
jgi:hypothetical protein